KKIGFFLNLKKDLHREIEYIADILKNQNIRLLVKKDLKKVLRIKNLEFALEKEMKDLDFLISFGGDGTLLAAARYVSKFRIPIMGLNFGTFGVLTQFRSDNSKNDISNVLNGKYLTEKRMRIEAKVKRGRKIYSFDSALNDFVIGRSGFSRIITLETKINRTYLGSYRSDGLIIATPTGSTAYSLSAGGPLIYPEHNSILITPLNPHTLTVRPLVISAQDKITVKISDTDNSATLTGDGQVGMKLKNDDTIIFRGSSKYTELIMPEDYSFYYSVRDKLGWAK
ncbi:MAG: NAD(+)/NADH kinase, partial [Actinomycetia bacterium]|nr:NAD(+)/NADH kinase [Actinomycetes bacterium]